MVGLTEAKMWRRPKGPSRMNPCQSSQPLSNPWVTRVPCASRLSLGSRAGRSTPLLVLQTLGKQGGWTPPTAMGNVRGSHGHQGHQRWPPTSLNSVTRPHPHPSPPTRPSSCAGHFHGRLLLSWARQRLSPLGLHRGLSKAMATQELQAASLGGHP